MADDDLPAVSSRRFSRAELAPLLGNNPRAIAAFEALGADVSETLPEAVKVTRRRALRVPDADGIAVLPAAAGRSACLLGFDTAGAPVLTPLLTPFMFGAVGDGVADDTEAVQKAIDAATFSELAPGVVTGLGATFAVSRQITIAGLSDVTLEDIKLAAIPGTWPSGEAGAMLLITRPTSDATSRSRLSRIVLDCGGHYDDAAGAWVDVAKTGLYVKSAGSGTIINTVRVLYFAEYGIWLAGTGNGNNDIKLISCGVHEVTTGMQPKVNTYAARTAIGILLDASADVEFVGCTVSLCKTALVVRSVWNSSFTACKFWNGPVRDDPTSLTVSIEANANRCQFTACRFDDGAVRLYAALDANGKHRGMNHAFVGCGFIQFPSGLLQLVTSVEGETAESLTVSGCILEQDAVVLLTEGAGTWAGVQCEWVGNRRTNGTDCTIQGCTTVTGALRLQSDGRLQVGNEPNADVPSASITPGISAHSTGPRASIGAARWSQDSSGAILDGFKSRGADVGAYAPVLAGDTLLTLAFSGASGATSSSAGRGATIRAVATGDWSGGGRKAKLVLATTDSTAPADRLEIDEVGVRALVPLQLPSYTVATLPAAASCPYARAFVSDATAAAFGSTPTGGGAITVPVWSDGTAWLIG